MLPQFGLGSACYDVGMTTAADLPPTVRDTLARLVRAGDRGSPTVFAGREEEFALVNDATLGTQEGNPGLTVVVQGVPGSGKTALLNEHVARVLVANAGAEKPVVPVPLRPSDLDAPPMAVVQNIDKRIRECETSSVWQRRIDRALGGASLAANTVFAAFTKRDFNDFKASARAPDSLPIALDDYAAFRIGRSESTVVLLVDEAQNLNDTPRVRAHLDALHGGVHGRTQAMLVCFGLANTVDRLRQLGLSRLAEGHTRTIGMLPSAAARETVAGTLAIAFADAFDEGCSETRREHWIREATNAILAESANFPQHLANSCRALAKIVLDDGLADDPPVAKLRDSCKEHKRRYYDERLRPWADHTIALAHAFGRGALWTPSREIKRALIASDNLGEPVDTETASNVVREMRDHGYIESSRGSCRPALPSLATYFEELLSCESAPDNQVAQAIKDALLI